MPTLFSPKLQMEIGAQCMYRIWPFSSGLLCLIEFNLSFLPIAFSVASLPAALPTQHVLPAGQGRRAAPAAARAAQGFHLHGFPLPKSSHLLTHEYPKITCLPLQICSSTTAGDGNTSSWISDMSSSNSKIFL